MEEILNMINTVGFPIVTSIYLLVRLEKRIEKLDDTIINLSVAISKICEK